MTRSAACGLGQGAQASPGQMLKASLAALGSARSVYLAGTLALQGATYGITLYEDDEGNAEGGVTLDQKSISVTWDSGRLFLRNPDYFAAQQLYVGSLWVLAANDALASVITKLANANGSPGTGRGPDGSGRNGRHAASNGQGRRVDTVQLSNNRISATVPTAGGAPVRLAMALDQALSDRLSDLKLTVTASSKPQQAVVVPTSYVDLAHKNTLPAQVGSCTVDIPAADNGGTAHAGCRVNWDTTAGDAKGTAEIINPA